MNFRDLPGMPVARTKHGKHDDRRMANNQTGAE